MAVRPTFFIDALPGMSLLILLLLCPHGPQVSEYIDLPLSTPRSEGWLRTSICHSAEPLLRSTSMHMAFRRQVSRYWGANLGTKKFLEIYLQFIVTAVQ
jgi:hypothetical protein